MSQVVNMDGVSKEQILSSLNANAEWARSGLVRNVSNMVFLLVAGLIGALLFLLVGFIAKKATTRMLRFYLKIRRMIFWSMIIKSY